MQLKSNLFYGFALLAMLAFAPLSAQAASLTATFMAAGGSAAITITNEGPDAVYGVSLKPSGLGVDPQIAIVNVGDIASGGKVSIKVDGVSPSGYILLDGTATDAAGQPVTLSIVSKEG